MGTGIPRVLKLKLDEKNKQILEYEEFSKGVPSSEFMGSATLIEDNVFLIGWGGSAKVNNNVLFSEIDFDNNTVLFEAIPTAQSNLSTYRVYKYKE